MMKISIYQVNLNKRAEYDHRCFANRNINKNIYDKIYTNFVDCDSLEDVFNKFNIDIPNDYIGVSMHVSDVVEVVESDTVEPGFYYCDIVGWKKFDFNTKE